MAWIEVHQALRDHRKILDLAESLDMPEPHLVGHLVYLWLWAVDNAPDGTLPHSRRIIEKSAGWQGAQGRLVDALVTCGLLDSDENGTLSIHDWDEYVGKLIDQRTDNAARQAAFRARRKAAKEGITPSNGYSNVTRVTRGVTALPFTVPNSTQQNTTEPLSPARTRAHEAQDDERETPLALGDGDDEAPPMSPTPSDLDEKRRRNGIKGACVNAWGKPDAAESGLWESGIEQLFHANYTPKQVQEAIPLYEQRRPKAARTPSGLARNIRTVLNEARASPPATASNIPRSSKPSEPTPEEWKAMNAKILDALSQEG